MIGYNTQIIVTESDSRESPQSKSLKISNSEKIYLNVKRAEKTSSRPAGNWERLSVVVEQHNSGDFFCKILAKNHSAKKLLENPWSCYKYKTYGKCGESKLKFARKPRE